jgi:dTDP-glucose pyrophosphorylase
MHDWRKVILNESDTMQKAIEVLNDESLRIVMVIDDSGRLVGTITDGDIRRGLIRNLGMDAQLGEFMFREPTIAIDDESQKTILNKMYSRDLLQIPVVDQDRKVVGLETLQHLLEKKIYDNPVFLMAGGFGKRLRPLTDHIPKPLLTVGGKPILETILNQFIDTGFHNFYISTHYKAEMVRDHFGDGSDWNVSIKYIHEDKPLGTAGALGLLPRDISELPILMMNGDLLTKINFEKLLDFHLEQGGDITMCVRKYDFQVPYGVINANSHRVVNIVEKPVKNFFVNAGIYVLSSSILNLINGASYLDMPHMINTIIEKGGKVNMFPLHEYWLDIGQIDQFEQAQEEGRSLVLPN